MYITICKKYKVGDRFTYKIFKEHTKKTERHIFCPSVFLFYSQIVPVAIPVGATPTGTVSITVLVAVLITETVLLAWFVT